MLFQICSGKKTLDRFSVIARISILSMALLIISCNVIEAPTGTPGSNTAKPTATPSSTATATATPEPTATATSSPTPSPLTSSEVFSQLSPAVVFIETSIAYGSGILFDDGYIVTNFHVVWPFEQARVVFADGTEYLDVPLLNWDPLADLAVLGPVDTENEGVPFVNGEDLVIGSEAYLMGYPGEVDEYPQPTITRGLISRVREWVPIGVTYFQTDAAIGGGQSGGVLLSDMGDVIGISNFSFSDAEFGLVASASDILPRVEGLIAGEDVAGLGERRISLEGGKKSHEYLSFLDEWDIQTFVIDQPVNTDIEITADGREGDIGFLVMDAHGFKPISADENYSGSEYGEATTELDAPYFVVLFSSPAISHINSIESNVRLIPFIDLDDDRGIRPGRQVKGSIDYPGDIDRLRLLLTEGDTVNILVDSILIDPFFLITRDGYGGEQVVSDDDTGGGTFGTNAELTFIAPDSGVYWLVIVDSVGTGIGGYIVNIREPYDGAPTPVSPKPTPYSLRSEYGPMDIFRSVNGSFLMQYPATWSDDPTLLAEMNAFCAEVTACYVGENAALAILEEEMSLLGNSVSQEAYKELIINIVENAPVELRLTSDEEFVTEQGLTANILTFDFQGLGLVRRFILVHDNIAFNATYLIMRDEQEFMEQLSEYTFSTVVVSEN